MMKQYRGPDEEVDIKKYMLRLLKRLPVLLGAVIGGAALGAVIYTIVRMAPAREYQAFAKIQLDFAADETGEAYQAYNGYTWNDLMAADPIMNLTLKNLSSDYAREEVEAALRAEILSDIRILTLTVTTGSAARTDEILNAAVQALETYGGQAKEFLAITAIQVTEAKLVVADSRMAQAVFVGAMLGLLLSLFGISFYYMMDDRVLVHGDIQPSAEVPFLGYVFEGDGPAAIQQDYENALAYIRERRQRDGGLYIYEVRQDVTPTQEEFQKMREAEWVILSLPFNGVQKTYVSYIRELLRVHQCSVRGAAIREADVKFLRLYYGSGIFGGKKGNTKDGTKA